MPLLVYRICKVHYAPFDGTGAALHGARWNTQGHPVIYASDSYAGALLEILVHARLRRLPGLHHCSIISIPDGLSVENVTPDDLFDWDAPDLMTSRQFGDQWLQEQRTAVLQVPALGAKPFGQNLLINPNHPDTKHIMISSPVPIVWDMRLFR